MEEIDREAVITRRMVDAMEAGELLALTRRHAELLGERFPKRAEHFYAPEITDLPHLLRRLYRMDPEGFREMVGEQCGRDYLAGRLWAAVLLSHGGTLPEEALRRLERTLPKALLKVEEKELNGPEGPYIEIREHPGDVDSALFWEVSDAARQLWTGQDYHYRWTRCGQLSKALELREKWLRCSHTDSAGRLYKMGWTPLDVTLSYLLGAVDSTYFAPVDPDCAAEAARRDPLTAEKLLDPDCYRAWFKEEFHPSYFMDMARAWGELLFLHAGWTDTAPLERGHRLKKVAGWYREILERLGDPLWAQKVLEKDLTAAGLLPGPAALNYEGAKLAKKQRLALVQAMVCQYLWRFDDLAAAAAAVSGEALTGLLWGVYAGDRLTRAFLLDGQGDACGEDGGALKLSPEDRVGIVTPEELTRKQLGLWKKRLKAAGAKPLIRQLSLPAEAPDFGAFEDVVTRNITVFTAAGKWGMDMPHQPSHCRADLLDPLHGYGARIWFERIWSGSEYSCDEAAVRGVCFYRMDGAAFRDYLPRRALVPPEAVPRRFAVLAGAAFRQVSGLK